MMVLFSLATNSCSIKRTFYLQIPQFTFIKLSKTGGNVPCVPHTNTTDNCANAFHNRTSLSYEYYNSEKSQEIYVKMVFRPRLCARNKIFPCGKH